MTTLKELLAQQEALEKQIAETRERELTEVIGKIRAAITEYGLTEKDLFGGSRSARKDKRTGTKIVTNAGGVNPRACLERMEKLAAEAGLSFRIAIVEGAVARRNGWKARTRRSSRSVDSRHRCCCVSLRVLIRSRGRPNNI